VARKSSNGRNDLETLTAELEKVAEKRLVEAYKDPDGRDEDAFPILTDIAKKAFHEMWEQTPTHALIRLIRVAVSRLPERNPPHLSVTWKEMGTILYGLRRGLGRKPDGTWPVYADFTALVRKEGNYHASERTFGRLTQKLRRMLAEILLEIDSPDADKSIDIEAMVVAASAVTPTTADNSTTNAATLERSAQIGAVPDQPTADDLHAAPVDSFPIQPTPPVSPAILGTCNLLADIVRRRWEKDRVWRQNNDPFRLPIRWNIAPDDYTASWSSIHGDIDRSEVVALDTFTDIARAYLAVPSGRLVILGQGGAGKSELASELCLSLLSTEPIQRRNIVPLVVRIDEWEAKPEPLSDWLYQRFEVEYDRQRQVPASSFHEVIQDNLILPIFDGFDELVPELRNEALAQLNLSFKQLVLLSRTEEYYSAVKASGSLITRAPAVVLRDLMPSDLANYLPLTTGTSSDFRRNEDKWNPVVSKLSDKLEVSGPVERLRNVLTTPLMASLARTSYSETDSDPADLIDDNKFREEAELSRHLVEGYVRARYRLTFRQPHMLPAVLKRAEVVTRALEYLAANSHANISHVIKWWSLRETSSTIGSGLVASSLLLLWMLFAMDVPFLPAVEVSDWLLPAAFLGTIAIFLGSSRRSPSYPHLPSEIARLTRAILPFMAVAALPIAILIAVYLIVNAQNAAEDRVVKLKYFAYFSGMFLFCAASKFSDARNGRIRRLPGSINSPRGLLYADIRAVLLRTIVIGPIFVAYSLFAIAPAAPLEIIGTVGTVLVGCLFLAFAESATFGFILDCFHLRLSKGLPIKLMQIMEEAHACGVLRRLGPLYAFRHPIIQDYLAIGYSARSAAGKQNELQVRFGLIVSKIDLEGVTRDRVRELRLLLEEQRAAHEPILHVTTVEVLVDCLISIDDVEAAISELRDSRDIELAAYTRFKQSSSIRRFFKSKTPGLTPMVQFWEMLVTQLVRFGRIEEAFVEQSHLVKFLERSPHRLMRGDYKRAVADLTLFQQIDRQSEGENL